MNLNLICLLCMRESGDTICSSLLLIVVQIVRWAPLVLAVLECVRVRTVRSARLWMGPAPVLLDSLDPCARMVGDNRMVGVGGVSRAGTDTVVCHTEEDMLTCFKDPICSLLHRL